MTQYFGNARLIGKIFLKYKALSIACAETTDGFYGSLLGAKSLESVLFKRLAQFYIYFMLKLDTNVQLSRRMEDKNGQNNKSIHTGK